MAEFTCPRCGNYFRGTACRACVGNVKGYVCEKCGERIRNPHWGKEYHIWVKSNMVDQMNVQGAMELELVPVP